MSSESKFLAINGKPAMPYSGPTPTKGALIDLGDGRQLKVLDIIYSGAMTGQPSVVVSRIVIQARYV